MIKARWLTNSGLCSNSALRLVSKLSEESAILVADLVDLFSLCVSVECIPREDKVSKEVDTYQMQYHAGKRRGSRV